MQNRIPTENILDDDVPFEAALPTIVSPPLEPHGKADVYIDNITTIFLDSEQNRKRGSAAVPLAIHIMGRPVDPYEPIPHLYLISLDKLDAEGASEEIKLFWDGYLSPTLLP